MEKVNAELFEIKGNKFSPIIRFIRSLGVGEVARIEKSEWENKTPLCNAIHSRFYKEKIKFSFRTMKDYYLVKRIK